ncbi:MAG: hypothetical protein IJH45_04645 [Firmicutes bacterium]|jgi:hypothetical protein|nr:hypothetical protein [Bacillota bacterium]
MACFLVSAAEAVVVKAVEKTVEKKEEAAEAAAEREVRIPWSRKLKWLSHMLWGGVILLAFEHVWHGEVVAWPPFLTAMSDPGATAEMLHEMATVGVCMALLITAVWFGVCKVADVLARRTAEQKA